MVVAEGRFGVEVGLWRMRFGGGGMEEEEERGLMLAKERMVLVWGGDGDVEVDGGLMLSRMRFEC